MISCPDLHECRGRLPTGIVAITSAVPESITVMSPEISFVAKIIGALDRDGALGGTAVVGEDVQPTLRTAALNTIHRMKLSMD
jgi:hypothetical protein